MARVHHRLRTQSPSKHSLSSSPSASAQSSTSTLPAAIHSEQSCSTSALSYSLFPLLYSGHGDGLNNRGDETNTLELVIQYGKGTCPLSSIPPSLKRTSLESGEHKNDESGSITLMIAIDDNESTQQYQELHVRWYRFQPSLLQDMERADIILCHAGAGTLLEALAIRRPQRQPPLINAVINSTLMNNHQSELAEELETRKHITVTYDCAYEWTTEEKVKQFWTKLGQFQPVPFASRGGCGNSARRGSKQNANSFQRIVDGVMTVAGFDHVDSESSKKNS